jgi:arginine N-succinyltransferase
MLNIRPVRRTDLSALAELLQSAPQASDAAAVSALIEESLQAQAGDGPVPQRLVLVLEEVGEAGRHDAAPTAALLGAVTLAGSTGLGLPRATYRTGTVVHASAELKMFHRAQTLLLCNDLSGCAEIGLPQMARFDAARALQRLLVDAALLFVAAHPDRFAATLVAELPGIGGTPGASPFWQGLGRHFHAGAPPQDSPFFPSAQRSHIARLMPKHPLYSALLGSDAQACIGRHAASAQALAEALQAQGLRWRGQVNLFDAGPVLEAEVADVAAVRRSRRLRLTLHDGLPDELADELPDDPPPRARHQACLISRMPHDGAAPDRDWCAALVPAALGDGVVRLVPQATLQLGLAAGQWVRVLAQA